MFLYVFPVISYDVPKTSMFLWFSYVFPIKSSIFLWFSYGFPIKTSIFLWFSYDLISKTCSFRVPVCPLPTQSGDVPTFEPVSSGPWAWPQPTWAMGMAVAVAGLD